MTATTYGKYRIVEKIGAGGFGEVFLGLDPVLNRHVAIKTCSSGEEELRKRFLREAEIAASLQHPNIITVFDFGYQGETPYLVQEYLSGEDLDHKIKRRDPLSVSTRLDYLLKVAAGLRYAHSREVIHRDVKPGNVRVLDDGQVRLMDFGIAKLLTAETQLTQTGMAMGTAAYLPPEQLLAQELDLRADLFSFGVLAYELLTYERPFTGESLSAVLYAIAHKAPEPLASRWIGCPPRLATVVDTCLAKEPADRYPSFTEVIAELESLSEGLEATSLIPKAAPPSAEAEAPPVYVPPPPPSTEVEAPPPVYVPPPPVPKMENTVSVAGTAARPEEKIRDREKANRFVRRALIGLFSVSLLIVAGLGVLWVAKRNGETDPAAVAAPSRDEDPPPGAESSSDPAPQLAEDPTSEGPAPGEEPATPEGLEIEEEPAPETEPAAVSRKEEPRADRPRPAPPPRPSSRTGSETPPAPAGADTGSKPELESAGEPGPEASAPEAGPDTSPEQAPLIVSKPDGVELGRLAPGQRVYADREFVYGGVPEEYLDATCLMTANDLRREESSLTFMVGRSVDVFVAHDQRITKKPPWLGSFRKTGQVITVQEGGEKQAVTTYDVYVRGYPAGVVNLGSSAPPRQRRKHRISMYTVFLRPR